MAPVRQRPSRITMLFESMYYVYTSGYRSCRRWLQSGIDLRVSTSRSRSCRGDSMQGQGEGMQRSVGGGVMQRCRHAVDEEQQSRQQC